MKIITLERMTMDKRTNLQNNNPEIESGLRHTKASASHFDSGKSTKRTRNECELPTSMAPPPPVQKSTDKSGKHDDRKMTMTYILKFISYLASSIQSSQAKRVHFSDENLRVDHNRGHTEVDYSETIKRLGKLALYFYQLSLRIPNGKEDTNTDDSNHAQMALACVLCALEGCPKRDIPQMHRQDMVNAVYWNDQIDCTKPDVYAYRVRLREIFQSRMDQYVGRKKMYMTNSAKAKRRKDTK